MFSPCSALVLLAGGLACWSIPLALVVTGALLLAGGLAGHYLTATRPADAPPVEGEETQTPETRMRGTKNGG